MDVNTLSYIALIALIQGLFCAFFIRSTFRKKLDLTLKFHQLLMSVLVGSCLNAAFSFFQLIFKMEKPLIEEFGFLQVLLVELIIGYSLQLVGTYFSIAQFVPETSVIERKKLLKALMVGIRKSVPIVTILEFTLAAILLD